MCIRDRIRAVRKIDVSLLNMTKAAALSTYTAISYNSRNCKIFEELVDMWLISDAVATYVAVEEKGFEYMLDRMGFHHLSSTSNSVDNASSTAASSAGPIFAAIDLKPYTSKALEFSDTSIPPAPTLAIAGPATTGLQKPANATQSVQPSLVAPLPAANLTEEELKEQEFATKLTLINLPGQGFAPPNKDWSIYKKGSKSRILFFQMNNATHNEYSLLLQMEKPVEIRSIKIGFITVWTDFADKVLGVPTSVLLEGGLTQNNLKPLATLTPINDEGYTNFAVKVFHNNFQTIHSGATGKDELSLEECFKLSLIHI
eukprot:TRINITY_DN28259_c0_g1_i1.p1 TRINITY_DN28259_c0_g1~~TRINITY_DN28259_c0_g1_i1.p1  ORF type:complete len:334 (-),score=80.63 TRINITY_DN28259_c0_g1_i1:34-978(-)